MARASSSFEASLPPPRAKSGFPPPLPPTIGAIGTDLESGENPESVDLLALDPALDKLCKFDRRLADVVQFRFFAGLSVEQTAEVMGVAPRTVKRDWNFARAWLKQEMDGAVKQ